MDKENLMEAIYDFNKDINGCIEQTEKDIDYKKDLVEVAKKHNRDYEYITNEIKELEITLRTLRQVSSIFTDDLNENNADIQEIIDYCED